MAAQWRVGVTGGIGSGKSIVCRIFKTLGVPVYDADSRARDLMVHHKPLRQNITEEFGPDAYLSNGELNRKLIAGDAFGNASRLEKLNNLVHPVVRDDYRDWLALQTEYPYVIKEAALIFEAGTWSDLDKVIVVSAPESLRLRRVLQRDSHRTEEDVRQILQNQMPEEEKLRRADFVILNDESQLVLPQVLQLHRVFTG
jgi:dephospho-CoA kinase